MRDLWELEFEELDSMLDDEYNQQEVKAMIRRKLERRLEEMEFDDIDIDDIMRRETKYIDNYNEFKRLYNRVKNEFE